MCSVTLADAAVACDERDGATYEIPVDDDDDNGGDDALPFYLEIHNSRSKTEPLIPTQSANNYNKSARAELI